MKGATADPFIQRDRRITRELHFCVWTPLFSHQKTWFLIMYIQQHTQHSHNQGSCVYMGKCLMRHGYQESTLKTPCQE